MMKIISLVLVGLEFLLFFFESDLFSWNNRPSDRNQSEKWNNIEHEDSRYKNR